MRLKYSKLFTFGVIVVNIILIVFVWKLFTNNDGKFTYGSSKTSKTDERTNQKDRITSTNKHIKKAITIIFRDFYHFENDLQQSIESIVNLVPNVQIIVVYDAEPYPPMSFATNFSAIHSNVKFINFGFDIRKTAKSLSPILQIKTKYVLLMPDSIRLSGRTIFQKMIREIERIDNNQKQSTESMNKNGNLNSEINRKILTIPFSSNAKTIGNCCEIKMNVVNWSIEYNVRNESKNYDMFLQKHAILVDTTFLKLMPSPLAFPFPEMFYIQAKMAKSKQVQLPSTLLDGKRLFTAFHSKQRRKELRKQQFKEMYKLINVKKVIRRFAGKSPAKIEKFRKTQNEIAQANRGSSATDETRIILSNVSLPLLTTVEYFGCEKNTRSCIGTVYNRRPFYAYLGRNTPPCCLEKLKSVFHHVIEELENVGIRYWLDNIALKSAVEINQLAVDAYEIDISFNVFDLERSGSLKKAQTKPLADANGFYWIKATDGHYFRVQFSKQNQIGVNLLPFEIKGDRVVPNGFFGWKAKEFSSEFLHPMSTVVLLNTNVMCPNNVREFLENKNIE